MQRDDQALFTMDHDKGTVDWVASHHWISDKIRKVKTAVAAMERGEATSRGDEGQEEDGDDGWLGGGNGRLWKDDGRDVVAWVDGGSRGKRW